MRLLDSKTKEGIRRFLEEVNDLWLMYLKFAESLEQFAHTYNMGCWCGTERPRGPRARGVAP